MDKMYMLKMKFCNLLSSISDYLFITTPRIANLLLILIQKVDNERTLQVAERLYWRGNFKRSCEFFRIGFEIQNRDLRDFQFSIDKLIMCWKAATTCRDKSLLNNLKTVNKTIEILCNFSIEQEEHMSTSIFKNLEKLNIEILPQHIQPFLKNYLKTPSYQQYFPRIIEYFLPLQVNRTSKIVICSADVVYINKYLAHYRKNIDNNYINHLILNIDELSSMNQQNITFLTEELKKNNLGFTLLEVPYPAGLYSTVSRFSETNGTLQMYLNNFRNHNFNEIVVKDINSTSFQSTNSIKKESLGVFINELTLFPWEKVSAAHVEISTEIAREFSKSYVKLLRARIHKHGLHWGIDQLILLDLLSEFRHLNLYAYDKKGHNLDEFILKNHDNSSWVKYI